jgi:hypothetical protein
MRDFRLPGAPAPAPAAPPDKIYGPPPVWPPEKSPGKDRPPFEIVTPDDDASDEENDGEGSRKKKGGS